MPRSREEVAERTRLEQEMGRKVVAKHKREAHIGQMDGVSLRYPGNGQVEVCVKVGNHEHRFAEGYSVFPSEELYTKVLLLAG